MAKTQQQVIESIALIAGSYVPGLTELILSRPTERRTVREWLDMYLLAEDPTVRLSQEVRNGISAQLRAHAHATGLISVGLKERGYGGTVYMLQAAIQAKPTIAAKRCAIEMRGEYKRPRTVIRADGAYAMNASAFANGYTLRGAV